MRRLMIGGCKGGNDDLQEALGCTRHTISCLHINLHLEDAGCNHSQCKCIPYDFEYIMKEIIKEEDEKNGN